jgi:hypothetical protein
MKAKDVMVYNYRILWGDSELFPAVVDRGVVCGLMTPIRGFQVDMLLAGIYTNKAMQKIFSSLSPSCFHLRNSLRTNCLQEMDSNLKGK